MPRYRKQNVWRSFYWRILYILFYRYTFTQNWPYRSQSSGQVSRTAHVKRAYGPTQDAVDGWDVRPELRV